MTESNLIHRFELFAGNSYVVLVYYAQISFVFMITCVNNIYINIINLSRETFAWAWGFWFDSYWSLVTFSANVTLINVNSYYC